MHQPDAETLAAIVEEAGNQELLVGHAAGPKRRYDIEAVSTICRRHVIEYRKLRRRQQRLNRCTLSDRHVGVEVRPGSTDLRGPPASCQRLELPDR